ncbi:MAG: chorismate synthase [Acidobacteria bacterium]|nr:chorismate synthase [Acidobacteriota bacterium]
MSIFRFYTAGESHGRALVTILEGIPAGLPIDPEYIDHQLRRRQGGYGRGGRQKIERDEVQVLSGVRHGEALGSPIALMIENRDFSHWQEVMSVRPVGIEESKARRLTRPRPGHADLAGGLKYDRDDLRDILERASARETAARVAAGSVARLLLSAFGIEIASHTLMLGGIPLDWSSQVPWEKIAAISVDSALHCADQEGERQMIARIDQAKHDGDTLGGVFEVVARNVPAGLGSHTQWDLKLDGRLARAIMSIQAVKAVEIGDGARVSGLPGSQSQDEIHYDAKAGKFFRPSNHAGGLEGGMTNGEEVRIRGHLKPISTLRRPLMSVDLQSKQPAEAAFERSDITAVPAAGVIGEAMVALALAEAMREKFGGDSLAEMKRNFEGYIEQMAQF